MKKIDLTFGIPAYNCEEYIEELLYCFKNSQHFTYEIIVVNDGSTDNTLKICENFKNKNLKIF